MAMCAGSLLGGIQYATNNGLTVGVVVIDEQSAQGGGNFAETRDQQTILAFANSMNYPVWLVELNPNPGGGANLPTHTRLRGLLPPGTPVVTKTTLNAFSSTNLHTLLQNANVDAFVIMGHNTNCCVKQTAVGGLPKPSAAVAQPGAAQHGYIILTCQQVLRGGVATWWNDPSVWFFQHV